MNKKNLDIVLKVLQKKYPFIIGLEYYYKQSLGKGFGVHDHNFKFFVDIDILHSLFPTATIDYEYLIDEHYLIHWATALFNEYGGIHEITMYGENLNSIISSLLKSIVPNNESFEYGYRIVEDN